MSRADALMTQVLEAESEGDAVRAERLHGEAIAELQRALELASERSILHARLSIELASIGWMRPECGGLDGAIERCRGALHRLRLKKLREREAGVVTLAELLAERGSADPAGHRADLREAVELSRLVADNGRHPGRALHALPILLDLLDADRAEIARAFRRAFAVLSAQSFEDAGEVADDWARWAVDNDIAVETAEAHWCLFRTAVNESRRRMLLAEDKRELTQVQGLAAEAAGRLLFAERPRDAAVALDLARALQLCERMQRHPDGVDDRLDEAGRPDLALRWSEVGQGAPIADRAALDASLRASDAGTIRVGGQRFSAPFLTRDYAALTEHDRLVREISRQPGFEDVAPAPTYEELREAAADGPIVYLATAASGSFAIIVTEGSGEPEVVALPGLVAAEVDAHARALVDARDADEIRAAMDDALVLLRRRLMRPLAASLARSSLVTLVPVGALGLLPIHAAVMRPLDDEHKRTRDLAFRYAPHARGLLRARATARGLSDRELPIVTVVPPHPLAYPPLPYATAQSRMVESRFGTAGRVRRPASGSVADVQRALGEAGTWHLACHCRHDEREPLQSSLSLADGALTMRALFPAQPSRHRLAVLSACETTLAQATELDEVVSVSSALLHAGVAGVVASHSVVDARGAMALVLVFFERFLGGADPALALADAQSWLCAATNREIAERFGATGHPVPDHLPTDRRERWDDERPFADPHCWAAFSYCGA